MILEASTASLQVGPPSCVYMMLEVIILHTKFGGLKLNLKFDKAWVTHFFTQLFVYVSDLKLNL